MVGRLTPFMLFYTEHRDAVKARINTRSSSRETSSPLSQDISREICRLWQLLTPQQTKEYCLLSNLYAESLAKFGSRRSSGGNASGSGRQPKNANTSTSTSTRSRRKKDARLSGLPKPAVSSFMWFSRHHRAILRTENREMSFSEIGKAVGVLWKSATDEQKRPFEDLSTEVCMYVCVLNGIAGSPTRDLPQVVAARALPRPRQRQQSSTQQTKALRA